MTDVNTNYRIGLKDETKRGIASIKRGLAGLDSAFAAIGASLSLGGVAAFTVSAARSADQINKLSDRLSISTEALSEFQFVAQQSGVDFTQFATAVQRATRRISQAAEGTGEAVDALRELGLNARELTNLSPEQAFEVLAEALSRVDDEFRRVALAQKIFDSEGVQLLQVVKDGAAGIQAYREQFRQLGGTLDQLTADVGTEVIEAFGRFDAAQKALSRGLLRSLGPSIAAISDGLANLLPRAVNFAIRSFEGLRAIVAAFVRDVLNFAGLEDLARSFDNVAQEAVDNVVQLRDEMDNFGKTLAAVNTEELNFNKLIGESIPTQKEAAEAAKQLAKEQKALADAAKEFGEAFDEANNKLEQQERALLEVATPAEEFQILVARFRREQEEFGISAEVTARRVTAAYEKLTDDVKTGVDSVSSETKDLLKSIESEIDQFSNNITDAFLNLGDGIDGFFKDIAKQVARFSLKQFIGDPLSKFLKEGFSNFFAGGFATGGFIPPGQFGVVGERGPELAFGGRSGQTITPMGSGGTDVTINNYGAEVQTRDNGIVNGKQQLEIIVKGTLSELAGRNSAIPISAGVTNR